MESWGHSQANRVIVCLALQAMLSDQANKLSCPTRGYYHLAGGVPPCPILVRRQWSRHNCSNWCHAYCSTSCTLRWALSGEGGSGAIYIAHIHHHITHRTRARTRQSPQPMQSHKYIRLHIFSACVLSRAVVPCGARARAEKIFR